MKNYFFLIMAIFLSSCGQKFYVKKDFSFYNKDFVLDSNVQLKTDGVYVLEGVWSSKSSSENYKTKDRKVYKFYKSGQSNFTLFDTSKKEYQDYENCLKQMDEQSRKGSNTLFEGYYRVKEDKMIIQNMNTPLRQFYYTYAFLEENKLKIVKETIEGHGEFDDKYFTKYYVETYKFVKLENLDSLEKPNW